MFTCCECGNQVEPSEMDLDERICHECLDKIYGDKKMLSDFLPTNKLRGKNEQNRTRS